MKTPIMTTLMALALSITTSQAVIYSGLLTSTGLGAGVHGTLTGTEQWSSGASFSWSVSDEEVGCDGWYYTYTLTVASKAISHATTEVSDTFELSNLLGSINDPGGNLSDGALDIYGPGLHGNSNPGIPANMKGIKVDTSGDPLSITWSFCSDRVPVWGDMYAKDGKSGGPGGGNDVYLYNSGYNSNGPGGTDTDPDILANPAASGSVNNHILVPNSISDPQGPPIPEPSTAVLGVIGLVMVLWRRRK